jgi:hypothetical protein
MMASSRPPPQPGMHMEARRLQRRFKSRRDRPGFTRDSGSSGNQGAKTLSHCCPEVVTCLTCHSRGQQIGSQRFPSIPFSDNTARTLPGLLMRAWTAADI